eukprot:2886657-Rhodomonas_salina.1
MCQADEICIRANEKFTCSCIAGYTHREGRCTACPIGTYKGVPGPGECTSCPEGTISMTASRSRGACICKSGYMTSFNGSCALCNASTTLCSTARFGSCFASGYAELKIDVPDVVYPGQMFQLAVRKLDHYGQTISTDSNSILQSELVSTNASNVPRSNMLGSAFASLKNGQAAFMIGVQPAFVEVDWISGTTELNQDPQIRVKGSDSESGVAMLSDAKKMEITAGITVCPRGHVLLLDANSAREKWRPGACQICAPGTYSLNPLVGAGTSPSSPACLQCPAGLICAGGANIMFGAGTWEESEGRLLLCLLYTSPSPRDRG